MRARLRSRPSAVVMQPGTGCNLDCRYCYLPGRAAARRMPVPVAVAVAETVNAWAADRSGFEVFWHGGEPLLVGRAHLAALMAPFVGVRHVVQTNATLVDDAWCAFFVEHDMRVGVSIDGPAHLSRDRVTRRGREAFGRIRRGIDCLRRNAVPFTALAVVTDPDPDHAEELYRFFAELGTSVLGVSIEERVGANTRACDFDQRRVTDFWTALAEAWTANPAIRIREIDRSLVLVKRALAGDIAPTITDVDPLPTITCDGEVVLIAPELAGCHDPRYGDFSTGNIRTTALHTLLAEAGSRTRWLRAHLDAAETCATTCRYAPFCVGPSPASSYFEHGRITAGMTAHCRTATIALADAICRPMLRVADQRRG